MDYDFISLRLAWMREITLTAMEYGFGRSKSQCSRILTGWASKFAPNLDLKYRRVIGEKDVQISSIPFSSLSGGDFFKFLDSQYVANKIVPSSKLWFYDVPYEKVDLALPILIEKDVATAISIAFLRKKQLIFSYQSRDGTSIRTVSPTLVFSIFGTYYLRALDLDKSEFRNFKISRMSNSEISDDVRVAYKNDLQLKKKPIKFRLNPSLPLIVRERLGAEWEIDQDGNIEIVTSECFHKLIEYELLESRNVTMNGEVIRMPYWNKK